MKKFLIAMILAVVTVMPLASGSIEAASVYGYSQNNVRVTSGLSVEQLRTILPARMKELAPTLYSIEHSEQPINALFLASIVKLESGNGTSNAYRNKNNVGGVMGRGGLRYFNSRQECLRYMHSFLNRGYINRGYTSVWSIGPKYCVGGNWAGKVNSASVNFMYKAHPLR